MSGIFRTVNIEEWTGGTLGDNSIVRVRAPDTLVDWLADLCVLRSIPLHYVLPDQRLLPHESIRFVVVDPTRMTRILDGVLNAVALGVGDLVLTQQFRAGILRRIACALAWRAQSSLYPDRPSAEFVSTRLAFEEQWEKQRPVPPGQPPPAPPWEGQLAGLLVRSEVVRRYPSMVVRASANAEPLGCVRRDRLAPSVLLALFHGLPDVLELQEPDEGVRFGVERNASSPGFALDYRNEGGELDGTKIEVPVRQNGDGSVLELSDLAEVLRPVDVLRPVRIPRPGMTPLGNKASLPAATRVDSTPVARNLQQTPYVQVIGHGLRPSTWPGKPTL